MSCAAGVHKFPKKPGSHLPNFGHQKGDTEHVLYRGLLVLEQPLDLFFYILLATWCMGTDTIFVYKEKSCSNYAENNRHCHIIFSNLGNQVTRICAPMTYSCMKQCHVT